MNKKIQMNFFTASLLSENHIKPAVIYTNADTLKLQILKDNKEKSGIYRWRNLKNGKSYIGSSVKLENRLKNYFNLSFLKYQVKNQQGKIYKAILKNGYCNFSLEIFEYCEPINIIETEQYYIDLLKPEYNILKIAGSLFGFNHSEETRNKLIPAKLGKKVQC